MVVKPEDLPTIRNATSCRELRDMTSDVVRAFGYNPDAPGFDVIEDIFEKDCDPLLEMWLTDQMIHWDHLLHLETNGQLGVAAPYAEEDMTE